ncbi:MAG: hypothetical protein ACRENQ_12145, partial [Gemmatimonadaceae bacterium]
MEQLAMHTVEMPRLSSAQRRELKRDLERQRVRLERLIGDETTAADRAGAAAMSGDDGHGSLTALLHGRSAERYQAVVYALER